MVESSSGQYHGHVVRPFGLVSPSIRLLVVAVHSARKADQTIGKLSPNLKGELQFVRVQHGDVIVDGQHAVGLDLEERIEAIAELVLQGDHDLNRYLDLLGPVAVQQLKELVGAGRRLVLVVPDDQDFHTGRHAGQHSHDAQQTLHTVVGQNDSGEALVR